MEHVTVPTFGRQCRGQPDVRVAFPSREVRGTYRRVPPRSTTGGSLRVALAREDFSRRRPEAWPNL